MEEFILAAHSGDFNKIQFLLNQGFKDPACKNNEPLMIAYNRNYYDIFKLLLNDSRVDPTVKFNHLLVNACNFNKSQFAKLLWNDVRVQKSLINKNIRKRISKKILEMDIQSF